MDFLVAKAKKGDKEALLKLIMDKQEEYYKLAFVYTKNQDDALDALEDMIVILYDNIKKLKKNASFYSWSRQSCTDIPFAVARIASSFFC